MSIEQKYTGFEKAKNYSKQYELDAVDSIVTKQEDGMLGYLSAAQFATTGSNIFIGGQIIDGNITVTGDVYATNLITSSTLLFTGSTNHGSLIGDIHTYTGSIRITGSLNVIGGINGQINATNGVISSSAQITAFGFISSSQTIDTGSFATTGSNTFNGNETISGSLFISGTTELGGNLVPKSARGATLGTLERPFADIFVSSGSINIASDIPGEPNTTLTNIGGNILVSAGGMRLVGAASFIAATGSFNYISGSMTQVGNYTQTGNYIMVGNKIITGSFYQSGSTSFSELGNTSLLSFSSSLNSRIISATNEQSFNGLISGSSQLTSSLDLRYAVTGSNVFTAGQTITGSLTITGSIVMDGTAQTYFSHTVTNPSNYVLHQFLTSSYHGATYAFSAHDNSTSKVMIYSNYIVAQGANAINSNIGGDSKVESGAGAPNPTFAVGFSDGYAQFRVTDTGTFTYRGIVQIY